MKIRFHPLVVIVFFILQIAFSSCNSDDNSPDALTISSECIEADTITEIFTVVEELPFYGVNESDLSDYIISSIEIASLEQIEEGEIILRVIIFETGKPCLSDVFGTNVPEESLLDHDLLVSDMPYWTPGKQRDINRHVYVRITIKITNGEIESVN